MCSFRIGIGVAQPALDVTVISTLQDLTVAGAAATQGHALRIGEERKLAAHQSDCQATGISFVLLVVESLGGWCEEAVRSHWQASWPALWRSSSRVHPPSFPTSLRVPVERECHHVAGASTIPLCLGGWYYLTFLVYIIIIIISKKKKKKKERNTVAMRNQGGRKFFGGVSKCRNIVLRETAVTRL